MIYREKLKKIDFFQNSENQVPFDIWTGPLYSCFAPFLHFQMHAKYLGNL